MGSGTRFHKDWFRHSKVDWMYSQIHRQHGDLISLLLFFRNKDNMIKKEAPISSPEMKSINIEQISDFAITIPDSIGLHK
jgi:hypothetical protein